MARLDWDQPGEKIFDTGLDRGVLYPMDGTGLPWNGLISVEEVAVQGADSYFFNGEKYGDIGFTNDFSGKIKAFTYPDEFLTYEGKRTDEAIPGLRVPHQSQPTFGLSYRTLVGDDVDSIDLGYKIHILYNLLAVPSGLSYETLSDDISPMEFEWSVTSKPEKVEGYAPTAHVIADSRYMAEEGFAFLEDILYGTETSSPTLPGLSTLIDMLTTSSTVVITDHGDGTWSAEGPVEFVYMLDETTFEIDGAVVTYLDADTYEISSS